MADIFGRDNKISVLLDVDDLLSRGFLPGPWSSNTFNNDFKCDGWRIQLHQSIRLWQRPGSDSPISYEGGSFWLQAELGSLCFVYPVRVADINFANFDTIFSAGVNALLTVEPGDFAKTKEIYGLARLLVAARRVNDPNLLFTDYLHAILREDPFGHVLCTVNECMVPSPAC